MAYAGSQLNLAAPRVGDGGAAIWTLVSDEEPATVIAGYVTDGDDKGVKVNDIVIIVDTDGVTVDLAVVSAVAANGAVTMINGT